MSPRVFYTLSWISLQTGSAATDRMFTNQRGHRIFTPNPYAYIAVAMAIAALYIALSYMNVIPGGHVLYQNQAAIQTSLINSAAVIFFGILVIESLGRAIYYYMIKGINSAEARTLSQLFRVIAYALLILTVLTILIGVQNISGILVGAGFLGIVVGLAAQSTISNLISGIYLLASKTLEPGDYVNIQTWQYTMQPQTYPHDKFIPGFAGTIESIGVLYTKVIHEDGVPLYIPNSIVSQALVLNYHRAKEHKIKLQFDLGVSIPFANAEKAIDAVMRKHKITDYSTTIDYLHTTLYVISVRFDVVDLNVRRLRSEIFERILGDMEGAKRKRR